MTTLHNPSRLSVTFDVDRLALVGLLRETRPSTTRRGDDFNRSVPRPAGGDPGARAGRGLRASTTPTYCVRAPPRQCSLIE